MASTSTTHHPNTVAIPLLYVGTTARHRSAQAVWAVHIAFGWAIYGARIAIWATRTWLRQPIEVTRRRHVAVAVAYTALAVIVGLTLAAVAR